MSSSLHQNHALGHRERLRKRFLEGGEQAVADYELLELLLFAARPRGDVKPLAKELLYRHKTLAGVLEADALELLKIPGLGESGLAILKTAHTLTLKVIKQPLFEMPLLNSIDHVVNYCKASMGYLKIEQFRVLFLNRQNYLIKDEIQQTGTIDQTPVYPREVVKRALDLGASAFIMVHNHPSGDPTPSEADIAITKRIKQVSEPLGIRLHDHVIIAKNLYISLRKEGLF
jgi:DNA repair protein RadC